MKLSLEKIDFGSMLQDLLIEADVNVDMLETERAGHYESIHYLILEYAKQRLIHNSRQPIDADELWELLAKDRKSIKKLDKAIQKWGIYRELVTTQAPALLAEIEQALGGHLQAESPNSNEQAELTEGQP
ncbi:MAG TPA: hypothetical protein PK299_01530 [Anaerolineales bacterium]|nr:hypothetical protein [Anaerolineales bacterium]